MEMEMKVEVELEEEEDEPLRLMSGEMFSAVCHPDPPAES